MAVPKTIYFVGVGMAVCRHCRPVIQRLHTSNPIPTSFIIRDILLLCHEITGNSIVHYHPYIPPHFGKCFF